MPGYEFNFHHEVMISRIQDWIDGKIMRLMLFMPPQHGKTQLLRLLSAYLLGTHPDESIVSCSYNSIYASKNNRAIQAIIDGELYSNVFPNTKLASGAPGRTKAQRNANFFEIVGRKGSYMSAGVGTGISGSPYLFGSLDDLYSDDKQAYSPTVRERVWTWFSTTFMARKTKAGAKIIIVNTRWHCLLPNANIMTSMGYLPIKSVSTGDRVLTSQGWQEVQAAASKEYSGEVISIRPFGNPTPLRVTPEHRVLTEAGWKRADDVTINDWLVSPIPKNLTTIEELRSLIPPPAISRAKSTDNHGLTGKRQSITAEELSRHISQGLTYKQIATLHGKKHSGWASGYAKLYGLRRPRNHRLTGDIVSDHDFWEVVGLWLAEGSLGKSGTPNSRIVWTFNSKEDDLISLVCGVLKRYGIASKRWVKKNVTYIRCSSGQLGNFLSLFGRGARNKFLPNWAIGLPSEFAKRLVTGYWKGDGSSTNGRATIASVSLSLLEGVRILLGRLGVPSAINCGRTVEDRLMVVGRMVTVRKSYTITFNLADTPWMEEQPGVHHGRYSVRMEPDRILYKVRSVTRTAYKGLVYDLQTPTHDFVANGVIVHNCDDLCGELLSLASRDPKADQWTVVKFPAILESESQRQPYDTRQIGEALWESRHPRTEMEAARASMSSVLWSSVYQQMPMPERGVMFLRDSFRYFYSSKKGGVTYLTLKGVEGMPDRTFDADSCLWFQTSDTADTTGRKSDFTCVTTFAVTPEKDLCVWHVWRAKLEFPKRYRAILDLRFGNEKGEWPVQLAFQAMENKSSGISMIQQAALEGTPFRILKPGPNSKVQRGSNIVTMFENGKVYHHQGEPWLTDAESELLEFPGGRHDDFYDTMAYAGQIVTQDSLTGIGSRIEGELITGFDAPRDANGSVSLRGTSLDPEGYGNNTFYVGPYVVEFPDDD